MAPPLPYLGVGLSYRWDLNPHILANRAGVDWLEVTPEHFLPRTLDTEARLALLAARFPLAGHSLELSVGADGEDEPGYREAVGHVVASSRSAWHGDHLCFTRAGDLPVRALTPVPFTDEAVEVAARNIRRVQAALDVPFIVENIAYYLEHPTSAMDEAEFLRRVLLASDAGLLLDLHNLLVNAINFRFDPYRFLDRLPLERVVQIHLAGGEEALGLYLDTHNACSPEEVFRLLDHVAPRCPVRGVNFEMDGEFPPFARLREELSCARDILRRYGAKEAGGATGG